MSGAQKIDAAQLAMYWGMNRKKGLYISCDNHQEQPLAFPASCCASCFLVGSGLGSLGVDILLRAASTTLHA